MNELPIMPIRAKYADQTTEGKDIDTEIDALKDKTEDITHSEAETNVYGILSTDTLKCDILTSDEDEISAQKPVVEVMSGYTFEQDAVPNLTIDTIYATAVKNGNKLTFCYFGKLTRTGTVEDDYATIASFNMPTAIGNLLVPYSVPGLGNILDSRIINAFQYRTTAIALPSHIYKSSNSKIKVYLAGLNSLMTENVEYIYRYEVTFLLSDNLAA